MLDLIKQWIINISAFVFFITILDIMIPSAKMKKLVRMAASIILITTIAGSLMKLFSSNIDLTSLKIKNSIILNKTQIEQSGKIFNEKQMEQIVELYRHRILEQITESVEELPEIIEVSADMIFNDDYNSDSFGEIKRIYLLITALKTASAEGIDKKNENMNIRINHVRIDRETDKGKAGDMDGSGVEKRIREKISQTFGLEKDKIIITLMEG